MTDDRLEPSFSSPSGAPRAQPALPRSSGAPLAVGLLVVAVLAVGGWYAWTKFSSPAETVATAPAPATAEPRQEAASAPQAPALVPAAPEDPVKAEDITAALIGLLGRDAVLKFLDTTDFPRRFVATVDNLGREHAPVAVWPVQPTAGKFLVTGAGDATQVATGNDARYAAFVAFVGSVDAAKAVDLYRRMYPALEAAYRDLGFTKQPLNARVLEVIDLLLATPDPAQPPKVVLTEVKGPIASPRPWTRYEYQDPKFERLAAGQKMLLRVGADNRKVLKAKLLQMRQQLVQVSTQPAAR
ncbi:DUF3014 domain-containing protein [Ramlibacter algicola]|uniref:DUF3014 domain-containing protein n=1 Tax=Ramlibacter algicola TaxID=2795217 RepID=A0A934Q1T3_9BURK|nr:DUF3014 domain-containing protein [Ramlibacter algicola]MBK0392714.1 DUF3014 domain-containing protein [Ramlibacter algicola]